MSRSISIRSLATRPLLAATAPVGVAVVYWWARSQGNDALESLLLALGVLALIGAAAWLAREGLWEALDHRALNAMGTGSREPGDWVAVAGRAVALEEEIKATLSQRPALACSYKVFERFVHGARSPSESRSLALQLRYEGCHLAPTGIETAAGVVPLHGMPDLVNLEKSGVGTPGPELEEKAERRGRYPPRYAARAALAAMVTDRLDVDWQYRPVEDLHSLLIREWVLPPGEQVCVFGRWDGRALVPSPLRPRGLPVYAGPPEAVGPRLGGGAKVFFVLAAIPLVAAAWLLWSYAG